MRRYRRALRCILSALFIFYPATSLIAQSSEQELRSQLLNKVFFLRDRWSGLTLKFTAQGTLDRGSRQVPFTLAGVQISDIRLRPDELTIQGNRIGIRFDRDVPHGMMLKPITIHIVRPGDGDYLPALHAIFAKNLAEMTDSAPDYWKPYLSQHFPSPGTAAEPTPSAETDAEHLAASVSPPELLKKGKPDVHR